jgi:hypothetical protein
MVMAVGDSGRIVLEIDPVEKQTLYSALGRDGITLKEWFLRQVGSYLRDTDQLSFFGAPRAAETLEAPEPPKRAPSAVRYSTKKPRSKKRK